MKSLAIYVTGFLALLVAGCSTTQKPHYKQAIDSDLIQSGISLAVLRQLDAGHTDQARKIAMVPVYTDMDFARFCSTRGLAALTPEDRQEWTRIARETLDYMLRHPDECDSQDLTVQAGLRGLRYFLTEPEDLRRLDELSERLETHKP